MQHLADGTSASDDDPERTPPVYREPLPDELYIKHGLRWWDLPDGGRITFARAQDGIVSALAVSADENWMAYIKAGDGMGFERAAGLVFKHWKTLDRKVQESFWHLGVTELGARI